jgi:M6 family metalloprotease-like protein
MRAPNLFPRAAGICLTVALAAAPPDLGAQDVEMLGRIHGVRPPPGYYEVLARDPTAYQFQRVWKEIARQVRERRRALAQAGDYATLNSHWSGGRPSRAAAQAAGTAVQGTLRIPVLIGIFKDSTHTFLPDSADLDSVLFNTGTPPPYSVTTYYDEVSNGLVTVTGDIIGWFTVDSASTYYEGTGNGLDPDSSATGDFIVELLDAADAAGTDFSIYDGDGDGYIDLVAVLHPLVGGECGTTHIWSHRWVLAGWGKSWSADGDTASDYMIQPAVGGLNGCTATQIMPIGTFSHELGHGMADLPDLYDTRDPPQTNGIGHWGLMAAGNWRVQTSPAHMTAWSKDDVGWIFIDTITATAGAGTRLLNPIINSDTALRINIPGTNEYFLLSNRQQMGSDAYLHGPGLLIWHVDPDRISARRSTNTVNSASPPGLALEQADGQDDLGNKVNRGDAGDPYPGTTPTTSFGPSTTPNSRLNDNSSTGVMIDSITVNADSSIAFRVMYNRVDEVITTSVGVGTEVTVDAVRYDAPYSTVWGYPETHTIAVDSIQGDTLTRHVFQSWSDDGNRSHDVSITDASPDTFTASLETQNRVRAVAGPDVGITSSVTLDGNGIAWLLPTDTITLEATGSGGAHILWSGDTATVNNQLRLVMSKPYTVRATRISITSEEVATHLLGAASLLSQDELLFLDLLGNNNGGFDIGDFRAWLQEAGLIADVVPAELLQALEQAETGKGGEARKEER